MGQDREPTEDPLVRRAVTLLIKRQAAVDQFKGYATPLTSLVPDLFPDAYAPIWPAAPDVVLAEETLRQAGYRARGDARLDVGISFSQPAYGDFAASAVALLDRRSFDETLFVNHGVYLDVDTPTFTRALERGETAFAVYLDAHRRASGVLDPRIRTTRSRNSRYAIDAIDDLLDEAALLALIRRRRALAPQVAALLLEIMRWFRCGRIMWCWLRGTRSKFRSRLMAFCTMINWRDADRNGAPGIAGSPASGPRQPDVENRLWG